MVNAPSLTIKYNGLNKTRRRELSGEYCSIPGVSRREIYNLSRLFIVEVRIGLTNLFNLRSQNLIVLLLSER